MMHRPKIKVPGPRFDLWILAVLHLAIAASAMARGMVMDRLKIGGRFGDIWQVIPIQDLHWSSFWYLHAQPPGYSLWSWFWVKVAPENYQAAIQCAHIGMALLVIFMMYSLARRFTGSRAAAFWSGMVIALNPALFYFEAYLLYEMIVITLVTASVWFLDRAIRLPQKRWLIGFILVLNALVMTRSLYHLVFLAAALSLAWPAWRRLRPVAAVALLIASLALPTAWYAKNYCQYGFFGSSSWFGWGIFRCLVKGYNSRELVELGKAGVISQMAVHRWPYDHVPSDYAAFGFRQTSPIPLLSHNDLHNINVPAISKQYSADTAALIRLHPGRYLDAVHQSYVHFCSPVSRFIHMDTNRLEYIFWEPIYSSFLYGAFITDIIGAFSQYKFGSMFYFGFPLMMIGGLAWAISRLMRNRRRQKAGEPVAPGAAALPWVMAYIVMTSVYVALVGTLFEYGENERFHFALEPLHVMIAAMFIRAVWRRLNRPSARPLRAD